MGIEKLSETEVHPQPEGTALYEVPIFPAKEKGGWRITVSSTPDNGEEAKFLGVPGFPVPASPVQRFWGQTGFPQLDYETSKGDLRPEMEYQDAN